MGSHLPRRHDSLQLSAALLLLIGPTWSTRPHLRPLFSSLVQTGCQCDGFLWPAAPGAAAARLHPDPPAAWRGGLLWRLQHRALRPQLLPVCTSCTNTFHPAHSGPPHTNTHKTIFPCKFCLILQFNQFTMASILLLSSGPHFHSQ